MEKSVLLAGRVDFWRSALTKRFLKEGWEIFRLGEAKPAEGEVTGGKVHFFSFRGMEPDAAEVFRTYTPSHVIYLPERDIGKDCYANLQAVLALSAQFGAGHFFLLSEAEVFPPREREWQEEETPEPATEWGRQLYQAEACARSWQKTRGLSVSVLRFAEVYGPGQEPGTGWMGDFLRCLVEGEPVAAPPDEERRDFLSLQDAVYAVYQAAARGYDGELLHIASEHPVSWQDFRQICTRVCGGMPQEREKISGNFSQAFLDSTYAHAELGWEAKRDFSEDLQEAWAWMREHLAAEKERMEEMRQKEEQQRRRQQLIPYAENIAGFILALLLAIWQGGTPVNPINAFDINYLYIGAMGILYGKRQSLLAFGLSCLILIGMLWYQGMNSVAILYVPQHLLHLTSYLLAAILTGYFADRRSHEKEAQGWQENQASDRYAFLRKMYQENTAVKDKLYRQIINMDDSIGRLYRIIRRLDSIETERVFTQAAVVTAEVLEVPDVAIYVMSRDRHYLRQRVRLGKGLEDLPRSQRVEDHAYIRRLVEEKTVYVNFDLEKNVPDLAAPIVYQDEVIAVLEVFGMDFEQWSLQQQNLLSITSRLISSSLGRAYQYENETQAKKYYGDTRILMEDEFHHILDALMARRSLQDSLPLAMLRLKRPEGMSLEELDGKLAHAIRLEDFVGFVNGEVCILLPDVTPDIVSLVVQRLGHAGIEVEVSEAVA